MSDGGSATMVADRTADVADILAAHLGMQRVGYAYIHCDVIVETLFLS